jgi:hypothetical protein
MPRAVVHTVEQCEVPGLITDMQELAEAADGDLPGKLRPLTQAYAAWIADLEARRTAEADVLDYTDASAQVVGRAREVLGRLEEGIALLAANAEARDAFRFANRAMWQQRVRSVWIEARKTEPALQLAEVDIPQNRSWRAFQLAFILINLPGITSLDRPDRGASPYAGADLLWFPTGGGKTEAPGTACLRLERSGVIMYPAWPGWIRRDHAETDPDSRRAVEPERLSVTG